jgi:hypothetical protein
MKFLQGQSTRTVAEKRDRKRAILTVNRIADMVWLVEHRRMDLIGVAFLARLHSLIANEPRRANETQCASIDHQPEAEVFVVRLHLHSALLR